MPRRLLRLLCLWLGLAAAATSLGAARGRPLHAQSSAPVIDLINGYADWVHLRRERVDLVAIDLDVVRQQLGRVNPESLPAPDDAPAEVAREHRRRLLASFALELAAIGSRRHASAAARLVEWACPLVRSHTPHDDFDRAWQLAALALLEGGIDSTALHEHLTHLPPELSDDPRVALARGIAEEQFSAPAEVLTRSLAAAGLARAREQVARIEGERYRASERAIARYREAAKDNAIAPEAMLRMGHVQLRMGRFDTALATWKDLDARLPEPALLYLLHLFRGEAYEGYDRVPQARDAYLAALKVSPGAHSATLRLAALAFVNGHGDDPYPLVDALLRDDDARRDPWWSYYAADWRYWYRRIERVRALLVQP
jgi:tetratricopeptide (TPR) repeat protein